MTQAIAQVTPQALTLFEQPTAPLALLNEIASQAGLSIELAGHVSASVGGATLRSGISEDVIMFSTLLSAELEFVAKSYTGGVNTTEIVWDECMDFIVSRFGMLNIMEIRHAFRLAASGELGQVNLKSYYGSFTVAMLGEVLTAYMDRRKPLYDAALRLSKNEMLIEAGNQKRSTHDKEAWKDNRTNYLLLLESPTIEHVTAYDYEFLSQRGEINLSRDEKWDVFDRAKQLTIRDMSIQAQRSSYFVSKSLLNEVEKARLGQESEDFKVRQRAMALRLAVLDWIFSKQ